MWRNRLFLFGCVVIIAGCSDEIDPEKVNFSGLYNAEIITSHWDYAPSYSSWETRENTQISVTRKSDEVYHISLAPGMDFTLASIKGDSMMFDGLRGYPQDYSFVYHHDKKLIEGRFVYIMKLSGSSITLTARK